MTAKKASARFLKVWPLLLVLPACEPGEAAGAREDGLRLARQWCAGCHSVDAADQGTDAAPSFASIAENSGADTAWLRAWLASPHPAMPDMNLSRDEIDDIVAYLSSLSRTR
jgi:cytochrome c